MDDAGAAALRFLSALQSHPRRGIMKRPILPLITCNGQLQIFHFYRPVSLFLPCSPLLASFLCGHIIVHLLFFSLPIFCFQSDLQLQKEYTTLPSIQPHSFILFSNARRRDERGTRKGSPLSIQAHDRLFCHSCRVQGKSQTKSMVRSCG